jgi:hypothetical protein
MGKPLPLTLLWVINPCHLHDPNGMSLPDDITKTLSKHGVSLCYTCSAVQRQHFRTGPEEKSLKYVGPLFEFKRAFSLATKLSARCAGMYRTFVQERSARLIACKRVNSAREGEGLKWHI